MYYIKQMLEYFRAMNFHAPELTRFMIISWNNWYKMEILSSHCEKYSNFYMKSL